MVNLKASLKDNVDDMVSLASFDRSGTEAGTLLIRPDLSAIAGRAVGCAMRTV
jgi:hypothetical protein